MFEMFKNKKIEVKTFDENNNQDLIIMYGNSYHLRAIDSFLKRLGKKGLSESNVDEITKVNSFTNGSTTDACMRAILFNEIMCKLDELDKKINELCHKKASKQSTNKSKNNRKN